MALDLTGEISVNLGFWWQDFEDEDHDDDGVFISDDYGVTWYKTFSFSGATHPYTQTIIDLDAAASAGGMSLNDVILTYNHVDVENDSHLIYLVGQTDVNNVVPVVVFRDEARKTLQVKVGRRVAITESVR